MPAKVGPMLGSVVVCKQKELQTPRVTVCSLWTFWNRKQIGAVCNIFD